MDLDKLLASFQAAADDALFSAPLIQVATYLPPTVESSDSNLLGSRRFLSALLMWLSNRQRLSLATTETLNAASFDGSLESATMAIQFTLDDQLLAIDVDERTVDFLRQYCLPGVGSYGDDFHVLFVEGTNFNSFLDVQPGPADLTRLFSLMDSRLEAYGRGDASWNASTLVGIQQLIDQSPEPRAGWDFDDWRQMVRSYDEIESAPAGQYKSQVAQYLKTIDQALGRHENGVAAELVRTYTCHSDASVQSGVWRVLRTFPPLMVLGGLVEYIDAFAPDAKWPAELVDLFDDDLDTRTIDQMADLLEHVPQRTRQTYMAFLRQAQREGSQHAIQLLSALESAD